MVVILEAPTTRVLSGLKRESSVTGFSFSIFDWQKVPQHFNCLLYYSKDINSTLVSMVSGVDGFLLAS